MGEVDINHFMKDFEYQTKEFNFYPVGIGKPDKSGLVRGDI